MNFEQKTFCADLILTDAIMDMAEEEGITLQEARSKFIKSKAYDALYDFETGLWANGPDYFRAFYKSVAQDEFTLQVNFVVVIQEEGL